MSMHQQYYFLFSYTLLNVVQSLDILPGVAELRSRLQSQLETRLEGERVGHAEDLCVCTMLDPRFKSFDFKRVQTVCKCQPIAPSKCVCPTRANARKWLINNYVENWAPKVEKPKEVDQAKNDEPSPKRRKTGFLDSDSDEEEDDDALADLDSDADATGESPKQAAEVEDHRREEVMKYLALPQVPHSEDFDLLTWWKKHQSLFPHLALMARQYLALPASSAGVERLFSAAGEMHDKKRKRTSEKSLSMMLNIKVNAD